MNISEIKKLLHHREPYLMVTRVDEIDELRISTLKEFDGNEFFFKSHFPNAPVVPGAMIQEFCTQSAGILMTKYYSPVDNYDSETTKGWAIGVLNKIESAKFFEIVRPNSSIEAKIELIDKKENLFKFKGRIFQNDKLKAKIKYNLVIVKDDILTN